eukprot:TRINITY_DN657_c0_g1_i1.p1 TRINITY_DN657_c0_g1~~TRINITY_DN657_c0_g1_i1.p1  ORF type:complete len:907 (+),score=211.93 TRINITY_DN657_c0_g1_i1:55-2775(+)
MSKTINDLVISKKVEDGLTIVRRVLEQNRNPVVASDVEHAYSDKFLLAEFLTAGACGSLINVFNNLGLDSSHLNTLHTQSKEKKARATLRFHLSQGCQFSKEETREVEDPTTHVTEVSGAINLSVKNKTITKIKEYFWNYNMKYTISTYLGTDVESAVVVLSSEKTAELKTRSKDAPHPATSSKDPIDVDITWLLQQLNEEQQVCFSIDRSSAKCHTPRRNSDIDASLDFFQHFQRWCDSCESAVRDVWSTNEPLQTNPTKCDLKMIEPKGVIVPVLPLFEKKENDTKDMKQITAADNVSVPSVMLPRTDLQALLREQERGLAERLTSLSKTYPANGFPNSQDASTLLLLSYTTDLCSTYGMSIEFVEKMIYDQLVKAVGKVVTADDFSEYMLYHNRKVFKDVYQPQALSYPVRTSDHAPEGFFGIERVKEGGIDEPVTTIVRKIESDAKMKFALTAASNVTFGGNRFVHSLINHRFSSHVHRHNFVASTRQFSSYIVLLGRIGGNELFLPSSAFILKNKDAITIPLMLEEVPSPKQFKSAIQSLSPEQQQFAKSYRSMQLESTLFGLCVIQIKPQLERVLNLNPGALQKEIALTQDLMDLFIKYQIASDLLSYECDMFTDPDDVPGSEKISAVKKRVAEIQEMLKAAKEEEIENEKLEAKAARPLYSSSSSSRSSGSCSSEGSCDYEDDECSMQSVECLGLGFFNQSSTRRSEVSRQGSRSSFTAAPAAKSSLLPTPSSSKKVVAPPKPVKPTERISSSETAVTASQGTDLELDVSKIPTILEKRFESEDSDDALRPTIIKTGETWTKSSLPGLLKKPESTILGEEDQKGLKSSAFDLLDALTRSGALEVPDADLHVVVATTHCFDKTLMDTVVKDNINPIEKLEKSTLIAATTIHGVSDATLLK